MTDSEFTWDLDSCEIQDDIKYFFSKVTWQINEAVMLLAGILPVKMGPYGNLLLSGRLLATVPDRDEIIDRAHKLKGLWTSNPESPEFATPAHFISWAIEKGFEPRWLNAAIKLGYYVPGTSDTGNECTDTGWEGFDPDAPEYPEQLDIATQAWTAARNDPTPGEPKKKIERWVKLHYPQLGPTAIDRIAKIANWDKSGGRPPVGD